MSEKGLSPDRVKHLELIQAIVTRLGNNSFLIKGWTLAIGSAFFVVATNRLSWKIVAVAFAPIVIFWMLDAFYLRQERLFRKLYDEVRRPQSTVEPFSMDCSRYWSDVSMFQTFFSVTLRYYYGALFMINFAFLVGALIRIA
ncbi:hypothetical protein [Micromonospora sp. NPDC001898]|uniref:hypothetical protein n=1 Tax=Micromonospora sp. NPDC001898 TaxID=3364221 RepID=UPI0036BBF48C